MKDAHPLDKTKVIREAYLIEGIGLEDCRSIFLEWLLELSATEDNQAAVRALLEHHADEPQDHPMTIVLRQAIETRAVGRRRGGAAGRRRD